MEQQFADVAAAMAAIQEQMASIQQAVAASSTLFEEIKSAVLELAAWRPAMEKSVEDIQSELGGLRAQIAQVAHNLVLSVKPPICRR